MLWPSPKLATVTLYPESASLSLPQLVESGNSLHISYPVAPLYPTPERVILRPPSNWQRASMRPEDGARVFGNVTPFTESASIRETAEGGRGAAAQIKPGQNARFRCVQIALMKAATGVAGHRPPAQP